MQLVSHVRLPLVGREFLMSSVESESLIREDSQCRELLLEAMKYHLLPEQRSLMTTQRTSERRPAGMRPYVFAVGERPFLVHLMQSRFQLELNLCSKLEECDNNN